MTRQPRPRSVYWVGEAPKRCDFNLEDLEPIGEFIDGATVQGPWAIMCPTCHKRWGRGAGTGRGQRFTKQVDGRWLKTEG